MMIISCGKVASALVQPRLEGIQPRTVRVVTLTIRPPHDDAGKKRHSVQPSSTYIGAERARGQPLTNPSSSPGLPRPCITSGDRNDNH